MYNGNNNSNIYLFYYSYNRNSKNSRHYQNFKGIIKKPIFFKVWN